MVPIRAKILFLAFLSLTLLSLIIFREYSNEKRNLTLAENSFKTIDEIILRSKVIHSLQKERGLSIAHSSTANSVLKKSLIEQRIQTNQFLKEFDNSGYENKKFKKEFLSNLTQIREQVSNSNISWSKIKNFYTQQINNELISILKLLNTLEHNQVQAKLNALTQLAYARENLGLLRATVTRYYQQKILPQNELLEIDRYFFMFQNKLQLFYFYMQNNNLIKWKDILESNVYDSINVQIKKVLQQKTLISDVSPDMWWKESTFVIDSMKNIEMDILKDIKEYLQKTIDKGKKELIFYTLSAILGLLFISLITILTVLRILKALSVLINSLRLVESNQDFGIRLKTNNNDEFGQLSLSINNLLTFTDTIIKEKDTLASIDLLTGTLNRRSFIYKADKEIARSHRYNNPLSLIFCDIDKFKSINDTHGHAVGDDVLKQFSSALKNNLRENDLLARWGGEEFVILTIETDINQAEILAEKLRKTIMELKIPIVKNITCSFGVAQLNGNDTLESLCERADQALYKAKNNGRNKVVKELT